MTALVSDRATRVSCPRCGRSLRPAEGRIRPHRVPESQVRLCPIGTPVTFEPLLPRKDAR